jgi:capsular exopolysaccharide synthesis family protein
MAKRKKKKTSTSKNYPGMLVTSRQPKSSSAEAFRTLRTNIEFSSLDNKVQTLLVTSATPNEGKSLIVANLGVSMAMDGKKVLIMDIDLRNPTLHKFFNADNMVGLTNILVKENLAFEDVLVSTHQENLFLLPTGPLPPNPAEVVNSNRLREFFTFLKKHFDIILTDAPPVIAVADASILASYLDGTVLVISSGEVEKNVVHTASEQLKKVKANVLGVVLNKMRNSDNRYYYSYYFENS